MRQLDQSGFVIHARDYGETSQIVDMLTPDGGRVSMVHKGARQRRKGGGGPLQPFTRYGFGWIGRTQLKTLISPEIQQHFTLTGNSLAAGFYINELIWYLVHHEDECVGIYQAYESCLTRLAESAEQLEIPLRRFERLLLEEMGYALQWHQEATSGAPINPDQDYFFRFGEGFYTEAGEAGDLQLSGAEILAVAAEQYEDQLTRSVAKQLFRRALAELLNGRELQSRKLLRS